MRLVKFAIVVSLLVAVMALASGVVRILDEQPDGTVRVQPAISHAAVKWYATKAVAAVGPENVGAVRSRVKKFVESN